MKITTLIGLIIAVLFMGLAQVSTAGQVPKVKRTNPIPTVRDGSPSGPQTESESFSAPPEAAREGYKQFAPIRPQEVQPLVTDEPDDRPPGVYFTYLDRTGGGVMSNGVELEDHIREFPVEGFAYWDVIMAFKLENKTDETVKLVQFKVFPGPPNYYDCSKRKGWPGSPSLHIQHCAVVDYPIARHALLFSINPVDNNVNEEYIGQNTSPWHDAVYTNAEFDIDKTAIEPGKEKVFVLIKDTKRALESEVKPSKSIVGIAKMDSMDDVYIRNESMEEFHPILDSPEPERIIFQPDRPWLE